MHKLKLLLAGMLFAAGTSADALDDAIALFKRQDVSLSTGGTASTTTTTTDDGDSTITTDTSTTPTVTTTETTSTITPPTSPTTTVTTETSTITPPTSASETSDTSETSETSASSPSLTEIMTSRTQEIITTITTVSDGSTMISTRTSSSVIPFTTSVDPASLADGNSDGGGSSGLSDSERRIIGGVVGGVGGALLLAGLAYTAWRIWGKKKNLHDDDLYDPNVNQDKLSATTGSESTPFQSTLDQYHRPGPLNTASNF